MVILLLWFIFVVLFVVINYVVGVLGVWILFFVWVILVGLFFGIVVVVILGDVFVGSGSLLLILVLVCMGVLGLIGFVYEICNY